VTSDELEEIDSDGHGSFEAPSSSRRNGTDPAPKTRSSTCCEPATGEAVRDAMSTGARRHGRLHHGLRTIAEMAGRWGVPQDWSKVRARSASQHSDIRRHSPARPWGGSRACGRRGDQVRDFMTLAAEQVVTRQRSSLHVRAAQLKVAGRLSAPRRRGWRRSTSRHSSSRHGSPHPRLEGRLPRRPGTFRGLLWSSIYEPKPGRLFEHGRCTGQRQRAGGRSSDSRSARRARIVEGKK